MPGLVERGNAHRKMLQRVDGACSGAVEEGAVDGGGRPVGPVDLVPQDGQSEGVSSRHVKRGPAITAVVLDTLYPVESRVVPEEAFVDKVQCHGVRPYRVGGHDCFTCGLGRVEWGGVIICGNALALYPFPYSFLALRGSKYAITGPSIICNHNDRTGLSTYRICRNTRPLRNNQPPKTVVFQRGEYTKPVAFDGIWNVFFCF